VELVRWSEVSWLVSDLAQRQSLASKDVNTEAEETMALKPLPDDNR
jgi:hypothetical protein